MNRSSLFSMCMPVCMQYCALQTALGHFGNIRSIGTCEERNEHTLMETLVSIQDSLDRRLTLLHPGLQRALRSVQQLKCQLDEATVEYVRSMPNLKQLTLNLFSPPVHVDITSEDEGGDEGEGEGESRTGTTNDTLPAAARAVGPTISSSSSASPAAAAATTTAAVSDPPAPIPAHLCSRLAQLSELDQRRVCDELIAALPRDCEVSIILECFPWTRVRLSHPFFQVLPGRRIHAQKEQLRRMQQQQQQQRNHRKRQYGGDGEPTMGGAAGSSSSSYLSSSSSSSSSLHPAIPPLNWLPPPLPPSSSPSSLLEPEGSSTSALTGRLLRPQQLTPTSRLLLHPHELYLQRYHAHILSPNVPSQRVYTYTPDCTSLMLALPLFPTRLGFDRLRMLVLDAEIIERISFVDLLVFLRPMERLHMVRLVNETSQYPGEVETIYPLQTVASSSSSSSPSAAPASASASALAPSSTAAAAAAAESESSFQEPAMKLLKAFMHIQQYESKPKERRFSYFEQFECEFSESSRTIPAHWLSRRLYCQFHTLFPRVYMNVIFYDEMSDYPYNLLLRWSSVPNVYIHGWPTRATRLAGQPSTAIDSDEDPEPRPANRFVDSWGGKIGYRETHQRKFIRVNNNTPADGSTQSAAVVVDRWPNRYQPCHSMDGQRFHLISASKGFVPTAETVWNYSHEMVEAKSESESESNSDSELDSNSDSSNLHSHQASLDQFINQA